MNFAQISNPRYLGGYLVFSHPSLWQVIAPYQFTSLVLTFYPLY